MLNPTSLSGVDLNLLPLLDALLSERHVTRAGRRVGLSQPAASRGLGRLRALFGDELLVRKAGTLVPTERGEALREDVHRALALVRAALTEPGAFDPAKERRTVRMMAGDYGAFVLVPRLVGRLSRRAPGIDLWLPPVEPNPIDSLVRGDVHFALSPLPRTVPAGLLHETLFRDRFVCAMRRGNPLARGKLTLRRFLEARHAFIAPRGARGGAVDDALAAMGKERRVAVAMPHFLAAPHAVAESDLVITLAERVARPLAKELGLVLVAPPLRLPEFEIALFRHARDEGDPALAWVRREIVAVCRGLA